MKGRHLAYNLAILMISSTFPHSQIVYNKAMLTKFNAEVYPRQLSESIFHRTQSTEINEDSATNFKLILWIQLYHS